MLIMNLMQVVLTLNNQAFFLQFYYLFLPSDKRPMVIVIPKVQGASSDGLRTLFYFFGYRTLKN